MQQQKLLHIPNFFLCSSLICPAFQAHARYYSAIGVVSFRTTFLQMISRTARFVEKENII
jgi:hypothetical protein